MTNRRDKSQFVKKYLSDGKINKEWLAIHVGTKMPNGAINCGENTPKTLNDILC